MASGGPRQATGWVWLVLPVKAEYGMDQAMMTPKTIRVQIQKTQGAQDLAFTVDHLICAGWVGRDRRALQAHIDELGLVGVPPPGRIPIYMNLSPYLLTTDHEITVISDKTSGEVEYVLLCKGNEIWVTVGSDQTDRDIETKSIPASKQMYAKCMAPVCWPLADLRDHWDGLILRCWVTRRRERTLYQESPLASILAPEELLGKLPRKGIDQEAGIVLFSGTISTRAGLSYGQTYALELEDPVLKRTIKHGYTVKLLTQYM
jgi:hypothetical protein